MSEKAPNPTPETLYRGITLPADAVNEAIFTQHLQPGAEAQTDAHGRQTVADGNEYGVYMTDNAHMSEVAYATPRRGDIAPESPSFNWKGASQSRIETPRVGVLYEIDTEGLNIRKPFIKDSLQGHYNNGFQGDEWIADSIPPDNHQVKKLVLGPDTLHKAQEFPLDNGRHEALEALQEEVANRLGRLAIASELIGVLPDNHRHFPGVAERALSELAPSHTQNSQ